jgi:hypothetical protein
MLVRPQKITFGELRSADVRGILVYRADYHCSHSIAINADQWPDDIRLSDSVSISTLPIAIDSHLEGPNRSRKFAGIIRIGRRWFGRAHEFGLSSI